MVQARSDTEEGEHDAPLDAGGSEATAHHNGRASTGTGQQQRSRAPAPGAAQGPAARQGAAGAGQQDITAASGEGNVQLHCFSEDVLDTAVHFQVLDLGRQLYVWAGTGEARMGPLCLASPPAAGATAGAVPPVATLIKGGASGADVAADVARRLALATGRSVAAAWALPEEPPTLGRAAERRLVAELRALAATREASSLFLSDA